jgi:hypothetical protein
MKFAFLLPTAALLLAGCSDPSAPTEANFRKAIEAALSSEPICETADINTMSAARRIDGPPSDYYLTLQKLGLVEIRKNTPPFPDSDSVAIHDTGHWTDKKGFCLATRKLEKIVRWTEPATVDGMTVTRVTYEWSALPVDWATADIIKALHFNPPQHDTREIVLTKMNDGWRAR